MSFRISATSATVRYVSSGIEGNATVPVVPRPSSLRPLRHIAEEPLVYDRERNEIHQPGCPRAIGEPLDRGQALELVWAPRMCQFCRPDITLALGR